MPVVTLTSDWGLHDHYLAAVKGKLLAAEPGIQIIDLNHSIEPFNLAQAAFVLRNSYRHFPPGTIHLVCTNTDSAGEQGCIVIKVEDQFFICADNGLAGLLFEEEQSLEVVRVKPGAVKNSTFPELDIFVPVACRLMQSSSLDGLGTPVKKPEKQVPLRPVIEEAVIIGSVIYIDSYQNAITNISGNLFERIGRGRKFEIFIKSNHYRISQLNQSYHETPVGELLALFNAAGLLEIAISHGNAASLLGLDNGSAVRVKFID